MISRRDFLKTTTATGLAVMAASGASISQAAEPNKKESKEELYGFFDVCCFRPDAANSKFTLVKPAEPIWDKLNKIHTKAEQLNAPLLSTTCLAVLRMEPNVSVPQAILKDTNKDKAFVAINASDAEVKYALTRRIIILERTGYPTPLENVERHAEDVFLNNTNAAKIVQGLGNRHWFVFGRGFQYCTEAVAVGLLALGQKVTILQDVVLPAGGEWSTLKPKEKTENYLKSLGANFVNSDSVLA